MANYKNLMAELREEYLQSFDNKFTLLKDLFNKQDWHPLELEFHNLKGTGTTYGVPEVSQLCEQVERLCREQKSLDQESLFDALALLQQIREKYQQGRNFDLDSDPRFLRLLEK